MRIIFIFIIFLVISFICDFFIYKLLKYDFIKTQRDKNIYRILVIISGVILPVTLLLIGFKVISPESFLFQFLILLFLLFILPKLTFGILSSIIILPFRKKNKYRRNTIILIGAIAFANVFIILYGALVGRTKLEKINIEIRNDRIPESFDGMKIVQISDFHLGNFRKSHKHITHIVKTINEINPDLIVFTGDLVNSRTIEAELFKDELKELKAKYGVITVFGNHDYGDYYNWESPEMKQKNHNDFIELNNYMGWQLLNNENTSISKGNDSIIIIGVENWGEGPFKNHADFAKAIEGVNQDNFMILLSHNPKHWKAEVINETMTDLTLSGHTHAMQTMFSFGPLNYSPAQWVYPEWSGLYTENNQHLYVNKGIGYVFIPWRIGAYPEITIFELKSSKD